MTRKGDGRSDCDDDNNDLLGEYSLDNYWSIKTHVKKITKLKYGSNCFSCAIKNISFRSCQIEFAIKETN